MVTSDGGYALAGYTGLFGGGDYDFWLVKTDEFGAISENNLNLFGFLSLEIILLTMKLVYIKKHEKDFRVLS